MIDLTTVNTSSLPFVLLEDHRNLPDTPCVYFAIDADDAIQYIGMSINPARRWNSHHRRAELAEMGGVKIAYLSVDTVGLLPEIEKALIEWFDPPLNGLQNLRNRAGGKAYYLSSRLQEILEEQNLTVYKAAQIVAVETGEELKTIHQRITRYLERPPKSLAEIEQIFDSLGYKITIEKQ